MLLYHFTDLGQLIGAGQAEARCRSRRDGLGRPRFDPRRRNKYHARYCSGIESPIAERQAMPLDLPLSHVRTWEVVMSSRIGLAWIGALVVLPHLAFAADSADPWSAAAGGTVVALADSLPTASIESICRDAQSAALPESKAAAYQSCLHDERAALKELRQKWAHYSAQARATCAEPGGGALISYVELQTCLDMQSGGSLASPVPAPSGASSLGTMASPPPLAPGQTK